MKTKEKVSTLSKQFKELQHQISEQEKLIQNIQSHNLSTNLDLTKQKLTTLEEELKKLSKDHDNLGTNFGDLQKSHNKLELQVKELSNTVKRNDNLNQQLMFFGGLSYMLIKMKAKPETLESIQNLTIGALIIYSGSKLVHRYFQNTVKDQDQERTIL